MQGNYSLDVAFVIISFFIALNIISFIAKKWTVFSDIIWILIFGVIYGVCSRYNLILPLPNFSFDQNIVFYLFIPPLIFAPTQKICLYHLRPILFSANLLATIGIAISMVIIAAIMHYFLNLPWVLALLFGVVMSATDPLAIAAILSKNKQLSKEKKLFIETESILNDGFVVTVFGILLTIALTGKDFSIQDSLFSLIQHVIGAMVLGIILGRLARYLLKHLAQQYYIGRFNLTVSLAYGSFILAETLHFSGILAVFFAALSYGYKPESSPKDDNVIIKNHLWEYLDYTINAALFFLLGASVATLVNIDLLSFSLIFLSIFIIVSSRFIAICSLWPVIKIEHKRLSLKDINILNMAGARGAVSIALLLILPDTMAQKEQLITMAFIMVLFTLIIYPIIMKRLLK